MHATSSFKYLGDITERNLQYHLALRQPGLNTAQPKVPVSTNFCGSVFLFHTFIEIFVSCSPLILPA